MNPSDAHAIIRRLISAFDELNIPYLIGGSMASSVHGFLRSTNDVDFVVRLSTEQIPPLVQALQSDFYIDGDMIADAIKYQSSFNVLQLPALGKADMFIAKNDELTHQQFVRRQSQRFDATADDGGYDAKVSSPEDIILQKLNWYRLGNQISERQWLDVQGVLKVQAPTLEYEYLNHWGAQLELTDLLLRAYDDAGISAAHAGLPAADTTDANE